ncbi:methionine--tRNA ligase [Thiovibrio frasassiensis]|uniref:Methionine--tRNA ligase n=1 Tax=Thiovibrio frasassiensis TaxID=2984131 RepID=A0A9X4RLU6_9BACT|nr:methionine--tRNA ligase [Thiovibrio frasassiensis]MDG4475715.1 methionine--tRNA ligase [Thiovibrio frasassiensis]
MTPYYLTTPIFYVNAQPHLGHAYSTVVADTVCRYQRLLGKDVRFQTGTDEHGDKIVHAAADAEVSVKEYVDKISAMFRAAWPGLAIVPDAFVRTTDPAHMATVQGILQQVYDQGDIYFSEYTGLYCKGCEQFLTEKELVDGKCPDHLTEPEQISEQNYFFRMSKYQEWLIDHINTHPEFITPERYRNEVLSFLKEPLEDLCISRPTTRLTWGIPLPFDNRFVTYVWFDALINYLSGLGYPGGEDFARYWPAAEHVIAKDILKPHAIYWPTMLKAMGLEPYKRLHVHGYWNMGETKMSKSLGNVVRPGELAAEFGADSVRYFLLREMSFGLDAGFSPEALLARHNSDLTNDLGNLLSRSLTMVKNFAASAVPQPGTPSEQDNELREATLAMLGQYREHMEHFAFHRALGAVWEVISRANKYIVSTQPWELAKDPQQGARLATVLYTLLETLRLITLTLRPIMPETAAKMGAALGTADEMNFSACSVWGRLVPGSSITPGAQLFPRLQREAKEKPQPQTKKAMKESDKEAAPTPENAAEDEGLVSFDAFQKLELRVAEIIAAEKIAKSDRLLKLTVKAPEERTIVAGIAQHYQPEELVGRQVIIVANLKPAKLMGVASHGMVLAAKDGDRLVLSSLSGPVTPGSRVA